MKHECILRQGVKRRSVGALENYKNEYHEKAKGKSDFEQAQQENRKACDIEEESNSC